MANLFTETTKSKPKTGPSPSSAEATIARILACLSPIQTKFVLDEARLKLARCPRRAGKSYADAGLMLYTAVKFPGGPVGYFGLTRDSAKEAIWSALKEIIETCKIECEINDSQLTITLPNTSTIRLFGADMDNMKNRFRGRKFKLVVVDECAFYMAIDKLVLSVLSATLMDLRGALVMTSSPGLLKLGLFYQADVGKQKEMWSRYTWTLLDNPHFQQPSTDPRFANLGEEELDLICRTRFNGDRSHPEFRREYLGEWVFDAESLVYPLREEFVVPEATAARKPWHVIGLNLAQHGVQGWTVLRCTDYGRDVQVVYAERHKSKNLNDLAKKLATLQTTYATDRTYAYLGKNPPEILDDFRTRYPLPLQANAYEKIPFYQTVIATDMDAGHVSVVSSCQDLVDEFNAIVRDNDGNEIEAIPPILADAFFAAYLNVYQTHLKTVEKPEPDDVRMERQLRERAIEEYAEAKEAREYAY